MKESDIEKLNINSYVKLKTGTAETAKQKKNTKQQEFPQTRVEK